MSRAEANWFDPPSHPGRHSTRNVTALAVAGFIIFLLSLRILKDEYESFSLLHFFFGGRVSIGAMIRHRVVPSPALTPKFA